MRGLLLTKTLLTYKSFVGYLAISLLISLVLFFIKVDNASRFSIMVIIFMSSLPALEVIKQEGTSNFDIYTFTLPVKRSTMVKSNYVHYLAFVLMGMLVSFVVYIISSTIETGLQLANISGVYASTFFMVIVAGAIVYPLLYLLGHEKSDGIIIGSAFVGVAALIGVQGIINYFSNAVAKANFNISLFVASAFVIAAFLIYSCSYCLSRFIFTKKDY